MFVLDWRGRCPAQYNTGHGRLQGPSSVE